MRTFIIGVSIIFGLTAFFAASISADEARRSGKISDIKGVVEVKPEGSRAWIPAKEGMAVKEGDIVKTEGKSRAILDITGIKGEEATVEIKEDSQLLLSELTKNEKKKSHSTLLDLAIGEVLIKAKEMQSDESKFEIKTPTSVVGVRGTEFTVGVEAVE